MTLIIIYLNFSITVINSFSKIESAKEASFWLEVTLEFIFILIMLFLLFILVYGNKMMRKLKAKEYGLYKLYGISNIKLFKIIALEQLTILLISFFISLVIGEVLTIVLVYLANMSIKEYLYEGFKFAFSIKMLCYLLVASFVEGLINSYLSYRSVVKKEVIELLNDQTNLKPPRSIDTVSFWVYFMTCLTIYATVIYALENQLILLNPDEIILLIVAWLIVIYLSYKVLAHIVIKALPKKVINKNENLFTFSLINRKLSTTLKTMTFITVFLIFLFILVFFGSYMQNNFKMKYPKEDVVVTTGYSVKHYNYLNENYDFYYSELSDYGASGVDNIILLSDLNNFLKENNFKEINLAQDEAIVVNPINQNQKKYTIKDNMENKDLSTVKVKNTVNIKEQSSSEFGEVSPLLIVSDETIAVSNNEINKEKMQNFDAYEGDYDYDTSFSYLYSYCSNEECYNYVMISESDINKYFISEGYNVNSDLDYGEFELVGTLHDNNQEVENWQKIYLNGKSYPIVNKQEMFVPDVPNSSNYVIVSDEQINEVKALSTMVSKKEYIKYKSNVSPQEKVWSNLKQKSNHSNVNIKIKSQEITNLYMSNMIAMSCTTFIAFVILIMLICLLSIQTAIDSIENKKEFFKLKKINYTTENLKHSVNIVTFIYFIVPLIVATINVYIIFSIFIKYFNRTSLIRFMDYSIIIYIVIVILLIYILFFLLVNYSYKKVVISKD